MVDTQKQQVTQEVKELKALIIELDAELARDKPLSWKLIMPLHTAKMNLHQVMAILECRK